MRLYGIFHPADDVDALVWRALDGRAGGLLLPYWKDSAVFVVVNFRRRYEGWRLIEPHRTYTRGSSRWQRHRQRIFERARERMEGTGS